MIKIFKDHLKNIRDAMIQRESKKAIRKIRKQVKFCGDNLEVFGDVNIFFPMKVIINNDCKLNDKVYMNARSGIYIGNDVTVSYGAKLISTGYDIEYWMETGKKKHIENQPIYIGNHCWIGADAIILPGVQITGEYVVVAAGSVVTKSIKESKVIVAGTPATIVKRIGENNDD